MTEKENNYAFIDGQNLHLGVRSLGWTLDYKKFRIHLFDKYHVLKAYIFLGYLAKYSKLYDFPQNAGYQPLFKPVVQSDKGIKGNIDVDLTVHTMRLISRYNKAIIVSGDGDFYTLVQYLHNKNKLIRVIAPSPSSCSSLLKINATWKLSFINQFRNKLEYKK